MIERRQAHAQSSRSSNSNSGILTWPERHKNHDLTIGNQRVMRREQHYNKYSNTQANVCRRLVAHAVVAAPAVLWVCFVFVHASLCGGFADANIMLLHKIHNWHTHQHTRPHLIITRIILSETYTQTCIVCVRMFVHMFDTLCMGIKQR